MGTEWIPIMIILGVVGLIIAGVLHSSIAARKRREALLMLSAELDLDFSPAKDHTLADTYGFLNKLAQGSNRYAFNVLSGDHRGNRVLVFDHHHETHSTNSKGQRRTQHHYYSVFILTLPQIFPELTITREGIFSKIAQAFGYDDIDFESHEFSRKFCVRCKDKKFAYDICHSRMMEFLLENDDLNIEFDLHVVALLFDGCIRPEAVRSNLERLIAIRDFIPDYVMKRVPGGTPER